MQRAANKIKHKHFIFQKADIVNIRVGFFSVLMMFGCDITWDLKKRKKKKRKKFEACVALVMKMLLSNLSLSRDGSTASYTMACKSIFRPIFIYLDVDGALSSLRHSLLKIASVVSMASQTVLEGRGD